MEEISFDCDPMANFQHDNRLQSGLKSHLSSRIKAHSAGGPTGGTKHPNLRSAEQAPTITGHGVGQKVESDPTLSAPNFPSPIQLKQARRSAHGVQTSRSTLQDRTAYKALPPIWEVCKVSPKCPEYNWQRRSIPGTITHRNRQVLLQFHPSPKLTAGRLPVARLLNPRWPRVCSTARSRAQCCRRK